MKANSNNSAGLRGQVAGETELCTVGQSGTGLTYRGYEITDLANNAEFEEIAFLLLKGHLPNSQELNSYKTKLMKLREIPSELKSVLEQIPSNSHPMDVMRTGCSMLGCLETEESFSEEDDKIDRMLALFPSIISYWYRYSHDKVRIDTVTDDDTIGAHFLRLLHDEKPSDLYTKVMNVSLILYAEHEFNASTFAARVCASTLSDLHSCITAAIGTLRGPLHGGANEAAMDLIQKFKSPDDAEKELLGMLQRKEKIMGFGHAVYKESDPRNNVIKNCKKGGTYQYFTDMRYNQDGSENYHLVEDILDNKISPNLQSAFEGDLMIFKGNKSLHRVTRVIEGERILVTFNYNTQKGIPLSEQSRKTFFGRIA